MVVTSTIKYSIKQNEQKAFKTLIATNNTSNFQFLQQRPLTRGVHAIRGKLVRSKY